MENALTGKWRIAGCNSGGLQHFSYVIDLIQDGTIVTGKGSNKSSIKGLLEPAGMFSFIQEFDNGNTPRHCTCKFISESKLSGSWKQQKSNSTGTMTGTINLHSLNLKATNIRESSHHDQCDLPLLVLESLLAEERHPMQKKSNWKPKKLYEQWPGENTFACHGRIFCGPSADRCNVLFGWLTVILTGILFFLCTATYIWRDIWLLVFIGTLFWLLTVYYYMRSCFTDPGVLPREHVVLSLAKKNPNYRTEHEVVLKKESENNPYIENIQQTLVDRGKWCKTCNIIRPPISTHCLRCNNCVSNWDHHCNFIANCVGQRNHLYFIYFNLYAFLCSVIFEICTIFYFFQKGIFTFSVQDFGNVFLLVIMPIFAFIEFYVTCVHLDLVLSGQTLKMRERQGKLNGRGCCNRWQCRRLHYFIFSYPPRKSLIRLRETVELIPPEEYVTSPKNIQRKIES